MADRKSGMRTCSFCGKSEQEINALIPGKDGDCFICDGCISVCADFIDEHFLPLEEESEEIYDEEDSYIEEEPELEEESSAQPEEEPEVEEPVFFSIISLSFSICSGEPSTL